MLASSRTRPGRQLPPGRIAGSASARRSLGFHGARSPRPREWRSALESSGHAECAARRSPPSALLRGPRQ
eukprot:scaffold2069_cov254-Pinguiococcus_pyrenoidosus.AAC.4